MLGTRTWRTVAAGAAFALLLGACGDDDDAAVDETTTTEAEEETTTTAADDEEAVDGVNPEFADYSAAIADIEGEDTEPTVEQMEAIRAAAPEEIGTEVDTLVDAFIAAIESGDFDSLFNDPELIDEFTAVEAFETENCGGGEDEESTGEINPEFAEYCALAIELDEQPDFATEEQLNEILAAAPEEIRAEAEIVVAGFLEAYAEGSPEAAFENPDVIENLGAIEDFDEANCGIDPSD